MSFVDLSAHPALALALAARGYENPTPVQASVLAPELAGRDLLVSSQTGSGKTVAFGLAMARELMGDAERLERAATPMALVIAPTRELALQVQRELGWLYQEAGARTASCVGGMEIRRELGALQQGPHIVVGTPGRLVDHLERGSLKLANLRALVLDEADEMLDMGFRDELERILQDAAVTRRTLLFSATMPRGIEELAARYQKEAARVQAGPPAGAHRDIRYRAHVIAAREREHAVVNVLRQEEPAAAIVFVSTRESVNHLHAGLVERGFAAVALSGELTQAERTRALKALRDGRARVLVATDVAARGLDLPDVGLVIHADLPHDAQVLQHRSGRTGRAGRQGTAVLLVPSGLRRAADRLIATSHIKPDWTPVPTADTIHRLDEARVVTDAGTLAAELEDEDRTVGARLLEARGADEVAAMLASVLRSRRPAPEELPLSVDVANRLARPARVERPIPGNPFRDEPTQQVRPHARPVRSTDLRPADQRPAEHRAADRRPVDRRPAPRGDDLGAEHPIDASERPQRGPRNNSGGAWFAVNIGRAHNADPRWLVPMLCRRGGISKKEIGAIRILQKESRVEIAGHIAEQFAQAVRVPDRTDANIRIIPSQAPQFSPFDAGGARTPGPRAGTRPPTGGNRTPRPPRRNDGGEG